MRRCTRFATTLLAAAAVALAVLVTASAQPQAGSKYGGTLVVGLSSGYPDSLDPTLGRSSSAISIFPAMCEQLYTYDTKLQRVPLLAASLPLLSKDKLSYTIRLRKGIRFNDGTPFNAQAVVTTVQRFMTYPGSVRESDYVGVDRVTAPGPYTVVFHLSARNSAFTSSNPYVLSPTQLSRLGAGFAAEPVCVGPFMFDHRVVGDSITLIKSPYYYDQKNVFLDKLVYKPILDAGAATAALKAGDIQALVQVSTTELPGIEATSNLRVLRGPQLGFAGVYVNIGNRNGAGNPPYENVGTDLASSAKLRQAFEEAIDRNTLNKVVFGGLMQVSCTPIAPANAAWFAVTRVPCTRYDPAHARKLVAESGIPDPTVRLLVLSATESLRIVQFIQAQEKEVGIDVEIESTDSATSLARAAAGNFDAFFATFGPGIPDPSFIIHAFVASTGVRNLSGYSSPRLDLILNNGLKATDPKARATLYRAAQQIIAADRPIIYLYNRVTLAAFNTSLAGVRLNYNGALVVANAQFK